MPYPDHVEISLLCLRSRLPGLKQYFWGNNVSLAVSFSQRFVLIRS